MTERLCRVKDAERDWLGQFGADRRLVRCTFDFNFVQTGQAGFHRTKTFLKTFGKAATD